MEFKKTPRHTKGSAIPDRSHRDTPTRPNSTTTHAAESYTQLHSSAKADVMPYLRRLNVSKKSVILSFAVIAVGGFLLVGTLTHQQNITKKPPSSNPNTVTETFKKETIIPQGKSIEQLGGWKRVSPPKSDPVFAYTDSLDGVPITVSQQILPESFKTSTDSKVAELAQKFSATTKITAGKTTAYVGSSSKGPQSVIFTKDNVLILIKSQKKIADAAWVKYIESLN